MVAAVLVEAELLVEVLLLAPPQPLARMPQAARASMVAVGLNTDGDHANPAGALPIALDLS